MICDPAGVGNVVFSYSGYDLRPRLEAGMHVYMEIIEKNENIFMFYNIIQKHLLTLQRF